MPCAVCRSRGPSLCPYPTRADRRCCSRSRAVIENAIQSCLQVATLTPENIAKARILRARARIANGWHVQAQDGLFTSPSNRCPCSHAPAQTCKPRSPPSQTTPRPRPSCTSAPSPSKRSVLPKPFPLHPLTHPPTQLLAPLPTHHFKERISNEVWREIALHLPRRDLKALLFVPHPLSRIASQLLFWELDLHFAAGPGGAFASSTGPYGTDPADNDDDDDAYHHHRARHHHLRLEDEAAARAARDEDAAHAQRSADILTRIITDAGFASAVRTLRIYALRRDEGTTAAFQTGMLANALPRLINLRNVHLSATSEGIVPVLRILQTTSPRLRGLSLKYAFSPYSHPSLTHAYP